MAQKVDKLELDLSKPPGICIFSGLRKPSTLRQKKHDTSGKKDMDAFPD